jgi:hypothetical protein
VSLPKASDCSQGLLQLQCRLLARPPAVPPARPDLKTLIQEACRSCTAADRMLYCHFSPCFCLQIRYEDADPGGLPGAGTRRL